MTLFLSQDLREKLEVYSLQQDPVEACGVLAAAKADRQHPRLLVWQPMVNIAQSPERFVFDPADQIMVWKGLDRCGWWPAAIFHSHPQTPAVPSPLDLVFASVQRQSRMLIYSVARGELRAWQSAFGMPLEEDITLLDTGLDTGRV